MFRSESLAFEADHSTLLGRRRSEDDIGGEAEDDAPASGADEDDGEDYNDNPALVATYRDGAQGPGAREEEVQRYNNTVSSGSASSIRCPPGLAGN